MYLENIFIENMGSIEKFSLTKEELIKEDGNPRVIIFVGKNGSGKTTLLSSIVDSFYQLAQGAFDDILPIHGMGYKYFKISGATNQKVNTEYGFSYIQYKEDKKEYEYIDKNGKLSFEECKRKTNNLLNLNSNWKEKGNIKLNTLTEKGDDFSKDFQSNSYCYFPSDRFEYPYWINEETAKQKEFFNDYSSFSGRLDKEILIRRSLSEVKNWILDIFLDSRTNIVFDKEGKASSETDLEVLKLLQQSIKNIEEIIANIMEKDIMLQLNFRNFGNRLKLIERNTKKELIPSLDNLSAGQSTLLSIFANIIKSSDTFDLNKSIKLEEIKGIVVIDEIDLHLHIGLQKDVLPKLIKLFPKVQFIVTSHSPFFLNGMAKEFNEDDYLIVNMPSGNILNSYDDFEEFENAYKVFNDLTNEYKKEYEELKNNINSSTKPLIITEGKTDWKHLKKALEKLKNQEYYKDLDIEFLEYEDDIQMGDKALDTMVKSFEKTPNNRKMIFIFDRDQKNMIKEYGQEEYKKLNNKVFAFCIPKLSHILDEISIEFYYDEKDITQEDENGRRLFIGTEFYKNGNSKCGEYQTKIQNKCNKQAIIDEKVYKSDDLEHKNSIALSKNNFAQNILEDKNNFDNFSVENFKKIFDVIKKIVNE